MNIPLLSRIRSYLSGGQRSDAIMSDDLPDHVRSQMLKSIDKECDSKINAMNNVELLILISKTLGPALAVALNSREEND